MAILRAVFILIILHDFSQVGSGQRYPWDGDNECGIPPAPPHSIICVDHDHLPDGICTDGVPVFPPWYSVLMPASQRKIAGVATLVVARAGSGKSDFLITTISACSLVCKEFAFNGKGGMAVFGMYNIHQDGCSSVPIANCYIAQGSADYSGICAIKLNKAVEFTASVWPACVEKPNDEVKEESIGYTLANDASGRGVHEVPRKVIRIFHQSQFMIRDTKLRGRYLREGAPFFKTTTRRYVMHGVFGRPGDSVEEHGKLLFDRLSPHLDWLANIVLTHSSA